MVANSFLTQFEGISGIFIYKREENQLLSLTETIYSHCKAWFCCPKDCCITETIYIVTVKPGFAVLWTVV